MINSTIQPIQTVYAGHRFRSRLEARWAVFFDALGLRWEYEKEGYDLGEAGWYLPDFWLPDLNLWCEIKGAEPPSSDLHKMHTLAEGQGSNVLLLTGNIGGPENHPERVGYMCDFLVLPYEGRVFIGNYPAADTIVLHHQYMKDYLLKENYLSDFLKQKVAQGIITGDVPTFDGKHATLQTLIELDRQYFRTRYGREHPKWQYGYVLKELGWCEAEGEQVCLSWQPEDARADAATPRMMAAYTAARQARFEHGETPQWQVMTSPVNITPRA